MGRAPPPLDPPTDFLTFSDGKEALANPDCDAMNLLEFIAFKCGWTKSDNEIGNTFKNFNLYTMDFQTYGISTKQ